MSLSSLIALYKRTSVIKLLIWVFVIIPGIPAVLLTLGFTLYAFWPRNISMVVEQVKLNPNTQHLLISAHGVNDSPASWSDPLQETTFANNTAGQQAVSIDWRPFSKTPLICSVSARRIGYAIGEMISESTQLKSVHAIGHSCGAFVALGICEGAKNSGKELLIQTTYLDPVSIYAGFFWDYGINHFGSCADFSDAYIDTEDGVPGSNVKLDYAHTFDVTQIRIKRNSEFSPHNWPTQYYLQQYSDKDVILLRDNAADLYKQFPQGALSVLKE